MKTIAIGVLLLVGFFVWRFVIMGDGLVFVGPASGQQVSAVVARVVPNQQIVLAVNNPDKEQSITDITVPRSVAAQLALSPPAGFAEEPLPLSAAEAKDKELVEFVEQFNRENVRWVGSHLLKPQAVSELVLPARKTESLSGTLQLEYARKVGFGGSISFFSVDLQAEEATSKLTNRVEPTALREAAELSR